jgi:hypothetical protein
MKGTIHMNRPNRYRKSNIERQRDYITKLVARRETAAHRQGLQKLNRLKAAKSRRKEQRP